MPRTRMILFPDHWVSENVELSIVPTPVGAVCAQCGAVLKDGERGVLLPHLDLDGTLMRAWHRKCLLRNLLGPSLRCYDCLDSGKILLSDGRVAPCLCTARSAQ